MSWRRLAAVALAGATIAGLLHAPPARLPAAGFPLLTAVVFPFLMWFGSAVALLTLWLASSVDRLSELVVAAARSAVPAVWVAPGLFLLAVATPLTTATGFALIATGVWLTFSSQTPRRRRLMKSEHSAASVRASPLTAGSVRAGFLSAQSVPVAIAGILAHLAAAAVVVRSPLLAGAFAASGTGLAALAPASRRAAAATGWRNAGLTFVGAVVLGLATLQPPTAKSGPTLWSSLLRTPAPETKPAKANVTTVVPLPARVSGTDLVPGVVLRPTATRDGERRREAILRSLHPGPVLTITQPLTLQFTGEYELFPESNGSVTAEASILRGTPLDAVYGTSAAGALATHAVQRFRPWLDCSRCGRLVLMLVHEERAPGLAKAFIESDEGTQEVGSDLYGWGAGTEETIFIDVPPDARRSRVFALRIAFHSIDPSQRSKSVRVAIRRLIWEPVPH